jgi:type VI secretion system secreted protein Hcp
MISNVHPNSGNGGLITEKVYLASSKFKCSNTQQKIGGGVGGRTTGGWDSAANKVHG